MPCYIAILRSFSIMEVPGVGVQVQLNKAKSRGGESVRVMISVSLDSDLISRISTAMDPRENRSAIVAEALEEWLLRRNQAPEVEPQKSRR